MVGDKRPYRSNGDVPCCVSGEAPSHYSPSKKQATGRDTFRIASSIETDAHRLETRLKQCQYGKNTIGYDNYIAAVPKNKRRSNVEEHPRTPDPYEIQSKRAYEGRIKVWRRALHLWDTKGQKESISLNPAAEASSIESIISSVQNADKSRNAENARSSSTRVSRSSNIDSNSNDSASDRRSSQSKRGNRKDNDTEESSNPKNGDKKSDDFRAEKDNKRRGFINSSDSRDNKQQSYRMENSGSPEIADGALGAVNAVCNTGSKHSDHDAQAPAVEVKDHYLLKNRPTESPPKTEMDVARDADQVSSTLQGQKSSFFETVAFGRAATAPGQHDRALDSTSGSKPSRQAGIFDDEEGPTVIFDEDSMQSVDYEKNMLNQDFNCDTVDILETVEEDDEDVL